MPRPVPDENILKRAFNVLENTETEMERFLREEHTAMISAARVGMDASRKIWPIELDHLPPDMHEVIAQIHALFENAYMHLDKVAVHFHGDLVQRALLGHDITTDLELSEKELGIGPNQPQAEPAPPVDIVAEPQPESVLGHPET
jgi:hypothetical protein